MIVQVQLENYEEFTNIGFAKAIIDVSRFGCPDLEEIAEHLLLEAKYRRIRAKMAAAKRMGVGE